MLQIETKYRSLSSVESEEIGRKLYREKDFSEAIKAFTAAITLCNEAPISALDSRAGTYEKLQDYSAAIDDAKSMIRHDQANVKGYLRAGKILMLQNKNEAAFKVYSRGLLRVPERDPSKKLLKSIHDRLDRSMRPLTASDPLQTLPLELAQMVVSYLDFRTLIRCLRISKKWCHFLENMASIWTELDLSGTKKLVSILSIKGYLRRSKGNTQKLILNRIADTDFRTIQYLFARCPKLEHLEIRRGFMSKDVVEALQSAKSLSTILLSENCEITGSSLTVLLSRCRKLRSAAFLNVRKGNGKILLPEKLENLQQLRLQCLDGEIILEQSFFLQIPNVHELYLRSVRCDMESLDFSTLASLNRLRFDSHSLRQIPLLPGGLEHFHLQDCHRIGLDGGHFDISGLVSLNLGTCISLKEDVVVSLLKNNSITIKDLRLGKFQWPNSTRLSTFLRTECPLHIEFLSLTESSNLEDSACKDIADSFPELTRLDLSITDITGVGIKTLVTSKVGSQLEFLNISKCQHVSSDAVDFARAKIARVEWSQMLWD